MNRLNITNVIIPESYYGFIYKTIFPDGKVYIGYTTKRVEKIYFGSGKNIQSITKKFGGKKNLKREILRFVYSDSQINVWERIYVKKFDSNNPSKGYNIQNGGCGKGKNVTETKRRISDSNKKWYEQNGVSIRIGENNGMFGVKRLDYRPPFQNKKHSDESRDKISKKVAGEKNPMFGRKHSIEAREKMRKSILERYEKQRLLK
jgi:group I intron endonuclease